MATSTTRSNSARAFSISPEHIGIRQPKRAGEESALDRLLLLGHLAGSCRTQSRLVSNVSRSPPAFRAPAGRTAAESPPTAASGCWHRAVSSRRIRQTVLLAIEAFVADVAVDRIPQLSPLVERSLEAECFRALDAAIESNPGHNFRGDVMLAVAAPLPDTVIRRSHSSARCSSTTHSSAQLPSSSLSLAMRD